MAGSVLDHSNVDKPLIVRVKRKVVHSAIEALWIEINERPSKRALLDFGKLSISDASSSRVEELKTKKVLVEYVETVSSSTDTLHVLQSVLPNSSGVLESERKVQEGRRNVKSVNKHDQILIKSKQSHQELSINARFEQIWRSRRGKNEASKDKAIHEVCQLYDVVRVDVEEHEAIVQKDRSVDLEDSKMLAQYLPLLRDILPTAASEIEHDFPDLAYEKEDGYVYDYYTVKEEVDDIEVVRTSFIPLVQVEDDDEYYDGACDSECATDDSNAEDNPLNDYPDEDLYDDEDEVASTLDEESDGESESDDDSESDDVDDKSRAVKIHTGLGLGLGDQISYYLEPQLEEHSTGVVDETMPSDSTDDESKTSEIDTVLGLGRSRISYHLEPQVEEYGSGVVDESMVHDSPNEYTLLHESGIVETSNSADVMAVAADPYDFEPYNEHDASGMYVDYDDAGGYDDYDDSIGGHDEFVYDGYYGD